VGAKLDNAIHIVTDKKTKGYIHLDEDTEAAVESILESLGASDKIKVAIRDLLADKEVQTGLKRIVKEMILLEIKHANADISSDDFRKQFSALRDECAAEIKLVGGGKYTPNLGAKFKEGVEYDGIVFLHYAPMSCKDYECDHNDDHNKMNRTNP